MLRAGAGLLKFAHRTSGDIMTLNPTTKIE